MLKFLQTFKPTPLTRSVRSYSTEGQWTPKKRVSRLTMEKIRALNASHPDIYDVVKLSKEFTLSVEGVRRILKSKFVPEGKDAERQEKNRYEAMGERRKEFKTNHPQEYKKTSAWKREEEKSQDISTAPKSNNWANDTYRKGNTDWKKETSGAWNNRSFEQDGDRSFGKYNNSERRSSYNNERRSFDRRGDRDERPSRSFRDNDSRDRPFDRSDNHEERPERSFNRENGDRPRRSFDNDRRPRGSFNNDNDGPRRNFGRDNEDRPRRAYNSEDSDRPRRAYNSEDSDRPRRSFNNDSDVPRRNFGRDNEGRPRRAYNSEENDRPRRAYNREDSDRPRRSFNNDGPRRNFGRDNEGRPRRPYNREESDKARDSYKREEGESSEKPADTNE